MCGLSNAAIPTGNLVAVMCQRMEFDVSRKGWQMRNPREQAFTEREPQNLHTEHPNIWLTVSAPCKGEGQGGSMTNRKHTHTHTQTDKQTNRQIDTQIHTTVDAGKT